MLAVFDRPARIGGRRHDRHRRRRGLFQRCLIKAGSDHGVGGGKEPVDPPARIGGIQNAQGPNIYQTSTVTRQIYEIRAVVESGNSGGPLLSPDGKVDGVVFAAAVGVSDTGFALTAAEVSAGGCAG